MLVLMSNSPLHSPMPSALASMRSRTEPVDRPQAFPTSPRLNGTAAPRTPEGGDAGGNLESTMSTLSRHQSWYAAVWAILQHTSMRSSVGDDCVAYMLYGARAFNLHLPSKVRGGHTLCVAPPALPAPAPMLQAFLYIFCTIVSSSASSHISCLSWSLRHSTGIF